MSIPDPAEARRRYDHDGYVTFRDVIDHDLISEASAHIDWLAERNPDRRTEHLFHDLFPTDPFWVRLVSDPRLVDIAELFLGPDLAVFTTHYISKPPGDGQQVLWHQDGSYWPLEPMTVVSLWLAIDESTPDNGCMRVIPSSHRSELATLRAVPDADSVFGAEMARTVDSDSAVDVVLAPGDVSVHHPNLVHGSEPNRSTRRRAGLTIRYIPTAVEVTEPGWPTILVRGKPVAGINTYLDRPHYRAGEHMPFRDSEE